jgi:hypothetical protein
LKTKCLFLNWDIQNLITLTTQTTLPGWFPTSICSTQIKYKNTSKRKRKRKNKENIPSHRCWSGPNSPRLGMELADLLSLLPATRALIPYYAVPVVVLMSPMVCCAHVPNGLLCSCPQWFADSQFGGKKKKKGGGGGGGGI